MAKATVKFEYGFKAALIGPVGMEGVISKADFIQSLEAEYPSAEGWEVVARESVPVAQGDTSIYLPYITYHLVKVNG